MNGLRKVADRRTQTIAARTAAAAEGDSRPRRATTIPMRQEAMAAGHRSEARRVEDALVCPVDRACVEFLCTQRAHMELQAFTVFGVA